MKYFRHLTTGRNGDRLVPIYAKFGFHKGYALYFLLLEICSEKYNGKQDKFQFLAKDLASSLQLRRNSLVTYLQLLRNSELITELLLTSNKEVISFSVPDLIEISDDYSKKVRLNSDKNPANVRPKKKKEKEEIKEEKEILLKANFDHVLEIFKSEIINSEGPKAFERFVSQITTEEKFENLIKSITHYKEHLAKNTWKAPKQSFATYLGTKQSGFYWTDYVTENAGEESVERSSVKRSSVTENLANLWKEIEEEELNEQS